MANRKWREQTIADLARAGVTLKDSRTALAQAATLQRLAEAQCNGDWPADDGKRIAETCGRCESWWAPESLKRDLCPDCRATDRARAHATSCGAEAITAGDPRGAVLSWRVPAVGPGERTIAICG